MRDFRDAKAMAQTLREALKTRSVSITHSESLELVAKILGFHDWNVLSARIQSESPPIPVKSGDTIPPIAGPASRDHLPTVPLRDFVLFPLMMAPLFVGRDMTKRALECAMAGDRRILVITQRHSGDDNPAAGALYGIGVTASVLDFMPLGDGTIKLLVRGLGRARIVHLAEGPFLSAEIGPVAESRGKDEEAIALSRTVLEQLKALRKNDILSSPYDRLSFIQEPGALADAVAPLLKCEISQRQELLETGDVIARLQKILALMRNNRQAA
jgi:ATP-dependent Lon protease